MGAQPRWVGGRSYMQGVAESLGNDFQAGHGANSATNVGGVTALPASGFAQPARVGQHVHSIEDAALGAVKQQATAERTQDGVIYCRVNATACTCSFGPVDTGAVRLAGCRPLDARRRPTGRRTTQSRGTGRGPYRSPCPNRPVAPRGDRRSPGPKARKGIPRAGSVKKEFSSDGESRGRCVPSRAGMSSRYQSRAAEEPVFRDAMRWRVYLSRASSREDRATRRWMSFSQLRP